MTTTTKSEDLKRHLTEMVESMPAFSESVCKILEMTSDINCSPKDLVKVVERDPVMTMKMLKMVNSAFFALSRNVSSVQHALVYLGLNTIKNIAVSVATIEALPRASIPELNMTAFLSHSLGTATVAQWLAKHKLGMRDGSDHFVAGLLHDFGKAVFIQFEPKVYGKIIVEAKKRNLPLSEVEMEHLGVTSAEVGAMLAERWKLPSKLVNCIRSQLDCNEHSSDLVLTVAAGNTIVKAMHLGDNGDPYVGNLSGVMRKRLGCQLDEVVNQMQWLPDEVQKLIIAVNS